MKARIQAGSPASAEPLRSRSAQDAPTGHRLHRGGDRDANSALWRVALVRMRCHQPTRDYVARRITEGKTKTEIMRCLKRYIARETFAELQATVVSA